MVTSQKISENEMGYRGSKSDFNSKVKSVKEQRVDGSWCINRFLHLRYTLMGFERNYQIKVLSKQLNKTNFCTSALAQVQSTKLDPWFVTGFCDGEASFSVSIFIDKRIKGRVGRVVKPCCESPTSSSTSSQPFSGMSLMWRSRSLRSAIR